MKYKVILASFFVFGVMFSGVSTVHAQAYTNASSQNQSQAAYIAQLQQLIALLQAQLAAQQGNAGGVYVPPTNISSPVSVVTRYADSNDRDRASLYGEADLRGVGYATVWFEYGPTPALGFRTLQGQMYRSGDLFRADLYNLIPDRTYYFRAVARDQYGRYSYGAVQSFIADRDDDRRDRNPNRNRNTDTPEVTTEDADDIEDTSAELNGDVDMNDFRNGLVFFVYGQDEDRVEDVEDEDEFDDIFERGDDLQKIIVDSDLDGDDDYSFIIRNLDEDEEYFFRICVEYEDEDDDETLECGDIEEFETDRDGRNNNDDEPDVITRNARDIDDDSAEITGDVDMNDFDNGIVFFVFGEDEDQIEDVEDDYETFSEIDEDGDDLQKERVDSDLDGRASYRLDLRGLDDDTDYFFQICVEYEDEDDDDALICGGVEEFTTDR